MSDPEPSNSLGLDFNQLAISDNPAHEPAQDTAHVSPQPADSSPAPDSKQPADSAPSREKKKPYVNPERVRTGGAQRDKLSEEALSERMARMREQNEKIKQRRIDVQADEDAFRQTQQAERAKIAHNRKVQENVDRTREQNAKRKMDKIQSREWDSGKPASNWKRPVAQNTPPAEPTASIDIKGIVPNAGVTPTAIETSAGSPENSNWVRGGSPRRGRGRGRGAGPNPSQRDSFTKPTPATPSNASTTPSTNKAVEKASQEDSAKEATAS